MAAEGTNGTVLILDDDLGFAMWLGGALNDAGLRALPASTSEEALAIVKQVQPPGVDRVIANLAIAGSGELLNKLASKNRSLKVIAIGGSAGRRVDARIRRPRGKGLPSPDRYVHTVSRVLQARD